VSKMSGDNGNRMLRPAPPLRRNVTRTRVIAVRDGTPLERPDQLATEEPMEIRAGGPGQEPVGVAVTMRTPGNDFELAVGFLLTEGLIRSRDEVVSVTYCELPPDEQQYNVVGSIKRTGFQRIRIGTFRGGHEVNDAQTSIALQWFRSLQK